jgi:translation initiation factor IF-2
VTDGIAKRGAKVDVVRNEEKIGEGKITGLQQGKKEVPEVQKRTECGMLYEGEIKVEEGDFLNFFVEEKRRIEL